MTAEIFRFIIIVDNRLLPIFVLMVHLGIFLLVLAFVSYQFITKMDYFNKLAIQTKMSVTSGYIIALVGVMVFAEMVYWGFYLIMD